MEEDLRRHFALRDGAVIRLTTGKPIRAGRKGHGYPMVGYAVRPGEYRRIYLHRLVFFLTHGFLPPEVDHRDRDHRNAEPSNLREASRQQNLRNRRYVSRKFPRGVQPIKRKGDPRYSAGIRVDGKSRYLGSFDTPQDASAAVEAELSLIHGEYYIGAE